MLRWMFCRIGLLGEPGVQKSGILVLLILQLSFYPYM